MSLFGMGLATPPPVLAVRVRVGAIGAGEPLATAQIRVYLEVRPFRLLGWQEVPEGVAFRYDGCRGKPAGSLCLVRGGRTP